MNYTEEQLKSALVRALPEKLRTTEIIDGNGIRALFKQLRTVHVWVGDGSVVTPHEWPAIVGMVEDGLMDEQIWQVESLVVDYHVAPNAFPLFSRSEVIKSRRAKWTTRAQALADIGAISPRQ